MSRAAELLEAVRIAIATEPGEWGVSSLADDLDVGARRIRTALRSIPHRRERCGHEQRLWPATAPDQVSRVRALLRRGPRPLLEVATHLDVCPRTAYCRLKAAGATARLHGYERRYVWGLA